MSKSDWREKWAEHEAKRERLRQSSHELGKKKHLFIAGEDPLDSLLRSYTNPVDSLEIISD
jgi:hypothetical protein